MLTTFADFLLGAALSRRPAFGRRMMRTPSRDYGAERAEALGWMSRVGTW
ncbi:hypothetical protein [Jannaschia seohaensis]|uniref:Uncharacterized protein n=1 Tax=Jannaschia seohaensis TaxID=475081 RepID=A0A2Y9A289_9RHOB|nr:hypothetical protein [Jannaschia seohaensis]PWJ22236.1 hypothetical protein BCF38_101646 [Jannaschia seohaensis]SSA38514.1 hypothetical protein SAMN05421539_101646 [Jannaschia seohaensis]